ncbi:hypothetical protein [Thiohalocapsa sp. ML1]|uniref:hypothetical protein n=1 Tax=Thiohalocapsa sp. ML1 TaxID=1431688 RepID=UPI00073243CA|nr:hypothetical protein [Thiohalocapsa sp. ML1]
MTIDRDDQAQVLLLRHAAEQAGHSRDAFLAQVQAWLETAGADAARRERVWDFAADCAERSNALAPDLTAPADLAAAGEALRALGRRMAGVGAAGGWLERVRERWPAPIAHEVARLADDLAGPRGADGRRLPPSPEAALLQARDTAEVLIKFSACVLLQGLLAAGGDAADWARRAAFQRGLSVGNWVQMLREAIDHAASPEQGPADDPLPALARVLRAHLLPFANAYPALRNRTLGHGARNADPRETADLVRALLETGKTGQAGQGGEPLRCEPLFDTLAKLVDAGAFMGWRLLALDADAAPDDAAVGEIDLTGAAATAHWLKDPRHDQGGSGGGHRSRRLPLAFELPDGARLALSPLLAARICQQCGRRDVLIYDNLREADRGGRFDLLDYARGHSSRLKGSDETDLGEAIAGLDIPLADLPPADLRDAPLSQGWVLRALDRARVDRNYDSPAYLRADLAAFLAENASGVYWLQAPAHVGKTTFIQGLAGDSDLSDAPIEARFDPHATRTGTSQTTGAAAPGAIVAYYCRKEYRPGVGALLARLEERLAAVYDPSDNVKNDRPLLLTRDGEPTPERFVAWLQAWREFAARHIHLTRTTGPLIVCIDGLDESRPPGEADWPLQLLPSPNLLPDGLYLVLTSRPLDDPTAPAFLGTHIAPLYAGALHDVA